MSKSCPDDFTKGMSASEYAAFQRRMACSPEAAKRTNVRFSARPQQINTAKGTRTQVFEALLRSDIFRRRALIVAAIAGGALVVGGGVVLMTRPPSYPPEVVEGAKPRKNEMFGAENMLMDKYGGETFKMARLPEMSKDDPNIKGNVYIHVPQKPVSGHLVVFLHGNGEQPFTTNSITNIIECTDKLHLTLMAPQDGGTYRRKQNGEPNLPANWGEFINPHVFPDLVRFAESRMHQNASHVTLASFSGGNVALSKILWAMQNNEEGSRRLYNRIREIILFDSADGFETPFITRWMDDHSDTRVFSYFNGGDPNGILPLAILRNGKAVYQGGNGQLVAALQEKKVPADRYQIEPLPKELAGHGVFPTKCEEYLGKTLQ